MVDFHGAFSQVGTEMLCSMRLDTTLLAPELKPASPSDGWLGKRKFSLESDCPIENCVDPRSCLRNDQNLIRSVPLSISNLRLEVEPLTAPALSISGKAGLAPGLAG